MLRNNKWRMLLAFSQLAVLLGFSRDIIKALVKSEAISVVTIGKRDFVLRSSFSSWLEDKCGLSISQLEQLEQGEGAKLFLSLSEAGDVLGVSYSSVCKLVRAGKLPAIQIGCRQSVSRVMLERWLGANSTRSEQV